MIEQRLAEKLQKLEITVDELKARDVPGSTRFTSGRIPFAGTSGTLTSDSALVWDNIDKRLGIGITPSYPLDIAGNGRMHNLILAPGNSTDVGIELGFGNTGNRTVTIDFRADDTYTDYAFRIVRGNTGANAGTNLHHRGTGNLSLLVSEAGQIVFYTNNVARAAFRPSGEFDVLTSVQINSTQVVSTRRTGWTAASGTATRSTFATSTVTLPQLAERVKALIDDLLAHGLIGA